MKFHSDFSRNEISVPYLPQGIPGIPWDTLGYQGYWDTRDTGIPGIGSYRDTGILGYRDTSHIEQRIKEKRISEFPLLKFQRLKSDSAVVLLARILFMVSFYF
jgi:hypothetical protein